MARAAMGFPAVEISLNTLATNCRQPHTSAFMRTLEAMQTTKAQILAARCAETQEPERVIRSQKLEELIRTKFQRWTSAVLWTAPRKPKRRLGYDSD